MTDSAFPSKPDNTSKKPGYRFQVKNSLSFRILFICLVLVLLPTFLYSFRLLFKVYRLKIAEISKEIILIGAAYEDDMEWFITLQKQNLATWNLFDIFTQIRQEAKPCVAYCSFFQQIAAKQELSSLYFIRKDNTGKFLYYVSNQQHRVGTEVYFSEQLTHLGDALESSFLAVDPESGLKEVFFSLATPPEKDQPAGYLVAGMPAVSVLKLPEYEHPIDIALLDADGNIFVSTNPKLSLSNLKVLSLDEVKKEEAATFPLFQTSGNISRALLEPEVISFGLEVPIKGVNYSLLLDVPDSLLFSLSTRNEFIILLFVFFGITMIGSLISYWITKRMAEPLAALSNLMTKVGSGNLNERYHKDPMGFEINELGDNFNQMTGSLIDYIQRADTEKIAKETLAKELKIGYEIQKTILPKEMPNVPGLDIAAGFIAAKEVGGDFYDVLFKEEEKKLAFAIADASGKGISACLYSLCLRSMLRSFDVLCDSIPEVINNSNALFCMDTGDTGMFVTAWVGIYDLKTGLLHYSSCGHLPAILCRTSGEIIELTTPGTAFGVMKMENVTASSVAIEPGDFVVLYTDGITEAHNKAGKLFGKDRMIEVLKQSKNQSSNQIVSNILESVDKYVDDAPRHDDMTILTIRRK